MKTDKKSKNAAYTGLLAAIAASSCCIPPVIALIAGASGGASSLAWMEPFRPYLIGLAIIAISYAWYKHLTQTKDDCGCAIEKTKWYQTKGFLIGISLFSILSISFPYYAHIFYANNQKEIPLNNATKTKTVNMSIKGMTCEACEAHVNHEVQQLEGIISIKTSYKNANTIVRFDASKTTTNDIKKAINTTGYTVTNIKTK